MVTPTSSYPALGKDWLASTASAFTADINLSRQEYYVSIVSVNHVNKDGLPSSNVLVSTDLQVNTLSECSFIYHLSRADLPEYTLMPRYFDDDMANSLKPKLNTTSSLCEGDALYKLQN